MLSGKKISLPWPDQNCNQTGVKLSSCAWLGTPRITEWYVWKEELTVCPWSTNCLWATSVASMNTLSMVLTFNLYITAFLRGYYITQPIAPNLGSRHGPKLDECMTYHKCCILKSGSRNDVISQLTVFVYLTFLIDEIRFFELYIVQTSNFVN